MPLGVLSQNFKLSWEDRCKAVGLLSTAPDLGALQVLLSLELPEVRMRMPYSFSFSTPWSSTLGIHPSCQEEGLCSKSTR